MKRFALLVGLITGLLGFSPVVSAAIITFDYSATDGTGLVMGTFGYDDSVADGIPGQATFGLYNGAGFLTGSVTGGVQDGAVFSLAGLDWFVEDNNPVDRTGNLGATVVSLTDNTATAFDNDSLPSLLNLADFNDSFVRLLSFDIGLNTFSQLNYTFTSITSQQVPVPAPGSLALFALGLVGLAMTRRRVRRSA